VTGGLAEIPGSGIRLSSVVLSWNSSRHIEACIRSLLDERERGGRADEVWIVDNGSTDGTVAILRRLGKEHADALNVIYLDRNVGTTSSRNMALRKVRGAYVAIVDSDVVVPAGTIAPLIARLAGHARCGLLAPKLVYPDGRPQMSTDVFPTIVRKVRRVFTLRALEKRLGAEISQEAVAVDYAISAFWIMRRDVLAEVGWLDERIFYSPEDVDYCLRVWKAGYEVVYDPAVSVVHCAQEISRRSPFSRMAISHVVGLMYLFRKHRYGLSRRRLQRRLKKTGTRTERVA
jgi:GT2 family glycosyltransferase